MPQRASALAAVVGVATLCVWLSLVVGCVGYRDISESAAPVCGNGVVETDEACDGALLAGMSCTSLGLGAGTLQCRDCAVDQSGCASCGDGMCAKDETAIGCPQDCAKFVQVACGSNSCCSRRADGTVYCWGSDQFGELGDGGPAANDFGDGCVNRNHSAAPVQVLDIDDAVDVDLNCCSACVRHASGKLSCWGANTFGELGDGGSVPGVPVGAPLATTSGYTWQELSFGGPMCGLSPAGEVHCWGWNLEGGLGTLEAPHSSSPLAVPLPFLATEVSAGEKHACAVDGRGSAMCWGRNVEGQLGSGATSATSSPVVVQLPAGQALSTSVENDRATLSAGDYHGCAILTDEQVWCWGWNVHGQLGVGGMDSPLPLKVPLLGVPVSLDCRETQSCALMKDGTLTCWGQNEIGQLGHGTSGGMAADQQPGPVVGLSDVRSFSVGNENACAVLGDGTVWCWGGNHCQQLGIPDRAPTQHSTVPLRVMGPEYFPPKP